MELLMTTRIDGDERIAKENMGGLSGKEGGGGGVWVFGCPGGS